MVRDLDFANELNIFHTFNVKDFSKELSIFKNADCEQSTVCFYRDRVFKLFQGVKERKSPIPNYIRGHTLKNCAKQVADFFLFYF